MAPFLLSSSLLAVCWNLPWHGRALAVGLVFGVISVDPGATKQAPFCVLLTALAAMVPPESRATTLAGAASICVLVGLTCGKAWSSRPALWDFLARWCQDYYADAQLRGDLSSIRKDKSCFGFHPHGCLAAGFTINGCYNPEFAKAAGKVNWLCDFNLRYKNPFFRLLCDSCKRDGFAIDGADKRTLLKLMKAGENVSIIPGGFQDAVVHTYDKDVIALKRRKGFIKYCLQYGYRVHPIYTFGESTTYHTFTGLRSLRWKVSEYNVPMIAFFGWRFFPMLPRPEAKIMTYVGNGIDMPQISEPTSADVDQWHKKYMEELSRLFKEKRAEAGWPHAELEIV